MKEGRFTVVLLGISLLLFSCATSSTPQHVPDPKSFRLPNDVRIIPPDGALPEELRKLSGRFGGTWGSPTDPRFSMAAVTVVEEVSRDSVKLLYVWDDYPPYNLHAGSERNTLAHTRKEDKIALESFSLGNARVEFVYDIKEDIIEGRFYAPGGLSLVKMKRIQ